MSAFAVHKGKKQGDRYLDDLVVPENFRNRKRRKSLQDIENGKKKKKLSPKKRLGEDLIPSGSRKALEAIKPVSSKRKTNNSQHSSSDEESPMLETTPFLELFNPQRYNDSLEAAKALFEMIIKPCPVDQFFSDIWEKKPILLRRNLASYNNGWFSTNELDIILQQNSLQYSVNVNIASYENGERQTHNPIGRAYASTVWEFYKEGCSVQLMNPQTYSKEIWMLGATLQELLGSFVGANVYLTPPGTQGFAPHYDDIEAFVMQVEGKKRWRLYKPRNRFEILPRVSSGNFKESELGELILDVVLEPGDLLYFPRGTVHQANALPDAQSLHITLSTFQRNTWGDLLEKLIPSALQTAIAEDEDFRKSLPIDYLDYMGLVHTDNKSHSQRSVFMEKLSQLVLRIAEHASFGVDAATDQMGLEFIHSSLPPFLTKKDKDKGVWRCNRILTDTGKVKNGRIKITLESEVKLIRKRSIRVIDNEETGPLLYYNTNNSRMYHGKEIEGMEICPDDIPGVVCLVNMYPNYVKVKDLPLKEDENKIDFCYTLFNQAILSVNN